MPETRKEAVIFTCMMAFGMVLGMASYNSLLHLGWQGPWISAALQNFFHEYFLAVPVAYFIGSPIAMRLTIRFWPWKERLFPIGMGIFTPCIMAPPYDHPDPRPVLPCLFLVRSRTGLPAEYCRCHGHPAAPGGPGGKTLFRIVEIPKAKIKNQQTLKKGAVKKSSTAPLFR
ncbi:DUF2798 domain-containing protein [Acidaminococcus timonensis]|uniref:DUF2798 domain-containing protein n=1 Tax=Acidaminococcus timonensis TaxID=1871002 RepID=UPI003A5C126F